MKLCASELAAKEQIKDDCLDGAFENKSTCDCWTDLEAFVRFKQASCGADYDNELTTIGVAKSGACSAEGLKQCTPFQQKQLGNYSREVSACSDANTNGKVVNVGQLCTCLDNVEKSISKINRTCGIFDTVKQAFRFQYDLYRCSVNKGTNIICDESKIEACSKGLSSCQITFTGAQVCSCYSSFGQCISTANVKNCPSAALAQGVFYPACKAICPALTDCGDMGVTFTPFPTPAPEPVFVTDQSGRTVTGPGGEPVTVTPMPTPAETDAPTPSPGGPGTTDDDPYEGCSAFEAVKAAFCAKDCFEELATLIGKNETNADGGKFCTCSQKIHDCVRDAGCDIKKASAEQKAECEKQCPGKSFCADTAKMIVSIVAVVLAIAIALF
jgi:hypothetical protein